MIYEFIATITAGFGMAGLAMIIKQLTKLIGKQAPKWLIPVFAAIGMLGFQVHQEYHWYEQEVSRLPDSVKVVKTIENKIWFRPWSYIKPQTIKFMAIDTQNVKINQKNEALKMVNLYLFEKRMSSQRKVQIIDCDNHKRADYITDNSDDNQTNNNRPHLVWYQLDPSDPILSHICQN